MDRRNRADEDELPIGEFIRKQLPFLAGGPWIEGWSPGKWNVQSFVQELVDRCLHQAFREAGHPAGTVADAGVGSEPDYEMLETDTHICVRYPLPPGADNDSTTVHVSRNRLRIDHGTGIAAIALPADVEPDETAVSCRNGWLDIRMSKSGEQPTYRDIRIAP